MGPCRPYGENLASWLRSDNSKRSSALNKSAPGTPVNIVDDVYRNTPLGWVLMDGDEAMVEILVELGADRSRALSP